MDESRQIWCYPKYEGAIDTTITSNKMNEDPDADDDFEFNGMDTDERINVDVTMFNIAFPDPLLYCIGFIA